MADRRPGLLFVVRRSVDIDGPAVLLLPGPVEGEAPPQGAALRLKRPDGSALVMLAMGKSVPSRTEPHAGLRAYPMKVQGLLPAAEIPPGTEVWLVDAGG